MLKAPNRTSALIAFIPRQVMLDSKSTAAIDRKIKDKEMEKENKKKKKSKSKPSETLDNGSVDPKTLALDDDGARGKRRQRFLSSIAAFLGSNGFHKTLSVFRSEAQLERDGLKASNVDLEDLFCKFLESSSHKEAVIDCRKEKDPQKTGDVSKDEIEHVHDASGYIHKKKRKHKKESEDGTNPGSKHGLDKNNNGLNSLDISNDLEKLKSAEDAHDKVKDKKKKKSLPEPLEENADKSNLEISCGITKDSDQESILPNTDINDKAKKRKKHKMSSDGRDEDTTPNNQKEKIAELNSLTNMSSALPAESNTKHKGKKKKKTEASIESVSVNGNMHNMSSALPAESNTKHKDEKKKKKKTEASIESVSVDGNEHHMEAPKESEPARDNAATIENVDKIEKKAHNKRKQLDSEERAPHDGNGAVAKESNVKLEGAENSKECRTPKKQEKSLPESEHAPLSKKRKTEKSSESFDIAGKASHQEQDSYGQDVQKESGEHQLANGGEPDKSKNEGETASKSKKKEKHSAEPKTVNVFQRVKIDEVKFADDRLQDNSYWALDDTGSGYGAKAQEVLGQVRGRDFRHEKTKKKRGTYRGGQIDLQSHSIKFNDSDGE